MILHVYKRFKTHHADSADCDEEDDKFYCTQVYCLETLLPLRERVRGDLKVPVSFGSKLNHEAFSYCTFLRSLSFLFEITPTHCLFICKGFFTLPPSSPMGEIICLSPLSTPHITSTNTETNTQRSNYKYMQ